VTRNPSKADSTTVLVGVSKTVIAINTVQAIPAMESSRALLRKKTARMKRRRTGDQASEVRIMLASLEFQVPGSRFQVGACISIFYAFSSLFYLF
jgi:hypothetical protein